MKKTLLCMITGFVVGIMGVQAQTQTWDPDGNDINDGGAGTWDVATGNWISGANWVNGNNAIFGSGTYQVDLSATSVIVGNLTYGGGGILAFKGASLSGSAGDTITINSGGATWDTGGGEIEFFNDGNNNNTRLSMSSGDTLTVQGGGTFDTGQNPQNSALGTWQVSGATLDVTEAMTVRGDSITVGAFDTVKLAGGSKYFHDRNSDRTYANNWELGAGTVRFDNRHGRNITLSGAISGDGRLRAEFLSGKQLVLQNAGNTFSGGLELENARVQVNSDGALGAAPGSFDADNISLKNSQLRLAQGITLNANRGITIESGATIEATGTSTINYGGVITGTGGLTFGRAGQAQGTYNLSGNSDYTGGTTIYEGLVVVGADEALGDGLLTIGGEGSSKLILNGNSQTVGGVAHAGSNTRQLVNQNNGSAASGAAGTLIIDVADGESYTYGAAYGVGQASNYGNFNTVKNGLGTQQINNMQVGGDLTVNNGLMVINDANANAAGATTVAGGTLRIDDSLTSASYATSGSGTLQIGNGGTAGNIGNADIANDGAVVISRSNASANSGVISGTGSVKVTGGGTHTLSAAQTYTGDTTLDNAVLQAGVANALSASSALRIGGAGSGTSAFEMNGLAQQIGGLNHEAGSHTREVRNNGADATLTINVGTGESYAYNANIAGSGTIDLVKNGDGTQTLGRVGTYTTALGDVTVSGGELVWNNNTASTVSGTVSVGAGGTLSGSGVLGVAVTVAGNLNPGNSPGTMTFDETLTLESTATLTLEITGTGASLYDILLNDGGDTLTANGSLAFDTTGYTAVLDDTITLFQNWGGLSGSFSSITGTDLGGGLSFDTSNLLVDGSVTVIPEPATLGMIAFMGGGLLLVRRLFKV